MFILLFATACQKREDGSGVTAWQVVLPVLKGLTITASPADAPNATSSATNTAV
ncbi:hypothetical protein F441_18925 [Phytophthora nicotianae CJ01A1]|uniref:Uncharacterized protein n=2 Tax=Phytophthora nicotianae TaxID=4792 RepID=V9E5N0_PHYNI|nr:hypothetical protein F443_19115 [Phytophthora nicotianae P1569]ETP04260.1 hypothetical protein F441_18925 [Phytophthora nicotianae CJ01A1]